MSIGIEDDELLGQIELVFQTPGGMQNASASEPHHLRQPAVAKSHMYRHIQGY